MTPYNQIFQLHAKGLNNSEIERTIGNVTRKTIISVFQLAQKYGYEYSQTNPMTDKEIHRILHPKRGRDERMPDLEAIIYELGLQRSSITALWKRYSKQRKAAGVTPYSKAMFQTFVSEAKESIHLPHYNPLLVFCYVKNAYVDKDGVKRGVLFAEMTGSEYVSMTIVPNNKARTWIHALIRIIHNFDVVPQQCCFAGHLPKAVKEMTADCLAYYGMEMMPDGFNKGNVLSGIINDVLKEQESQIAGALFINAQLVCGEYNDLCYSGCSHLTRLDAFKLEALTMNPLPTEDYDLMEYTDVAVQMNYHVEIDSMFYSVPFELRHDKFTAYISDKFVELHCEGAIAAVHDRLTGRAGQYSTDPSHIPPKDKIPWNEVSGKSLRSWAKKIGSNTLKVIDVFLQQRTFEVQAYKVCNALLHFSERYGTYQLEEACKQACDSDNISYSFIKTILQGKNEGQD